MIQKTYSYPDAGTPVAYNPTDDEHDAEQCFDNPFYPFDSEEEYNFAELVTSKVIPANVIDDLLKGNCGLKESVRSSLKSNYNLRQKIDAMEDGLGHGSWKKATLQMAWNVQHPDAIEFWHRDLIECAKWLLRQSAYEEHLTYTPKRCFNDAGHRVYNEMHTGDWNYHLRQKIDAMEDGLGHGSWNIIWRSFSHHSPPPETPGTRPPSHVSLRFGSFGQRDQDGTYIPQISVEVWIP